MSLRVLFLGENWYSRLILENAVIVGVTLVAVLTMKGQADWRVLRAIARLAPWRISRYQQAALILTLLSVGVMLVSGANVQLSLGVLLLGLTVAWTVGSDNRLLHYLCLMVGLAALVTPVGLSWRQHGLSAQEFSRSVQEFEANIPRLAQRYPLSARCGDLFDQITAADYPAGQVENKTSGVIDLSAGLVAEGAGQVENKTSGVIDLSAGLVAEGASPQYEVVGKEEIIPLSSVSEMNALLTQMGYPERERDGINRPFALISQLLQLPLLVGHRVSPPNLRQRAQSAMSMRRLQGAFSGDERVINLTLIRPVREGEK
jgi:hypothetical protein